MTKRVAVVLAMIPMLAHAEELSAGTIQITGNSNLGLSRSSASYADSADKIVTTAFDGEVAAQYYLTTEVGIGLDVGYERITSGPADSSPWSKETTGFVGPTVGYDHAIAEQVSLFADATVGYAKETTSGIRDETSSGAVFKARAGAKYFVAKSFSVDGGVRAEYARFGHFADPDVTTTGFGVDVGFSVYFDGK